MGCPPIPGIEHWEAAVLFIFYLCYCLLMVFNAKIEAKVTGKAPAVEPPKDPPQPKKNQVAPEPVGASNEAGGLKDAAVAEDKPPASGDAASGPATGEHHDHTKIHSHHSHPHEHHGHGHGHESGHNPPDATRKEKHPLEFESIRRPSRILRCGLLVSRCYPRWLTYCLERHYMIHRRILISSNPYPTLVII